MKTFQCRNTNDLMHPLYNWLLNNGVAENSRNGRVIRAPGPVLIEYTHPMQRVNLSAMRDANPFFHFVEAMWMLAGQNAIKPICDILPSFADFSDDGKTSNSAYGFRARREFGLDQLKIVGDDLLRNHESRQAIIMLWSPHDLMNKTKDKACNTLMNFSHRAGDSKTLDLHIHNRSNDAIWGGVSGANVVHFAFFLEYAAGHANMTPGSIFTYSSNLHLYTDNDKLKSLAQLPPNSTTTYPNWLPMTNDWMTCNVDEDLKRFWRWLPMTNDWMTCNVDEDLKRFWRWYMDGPDPVFENEEFFNSAVCIVKAHRYHTMGDSESAMLCAADIGCEDWRMACMNWLDRRAK